MKNFIYLIPTLDMTGYLPLIIQLTTVGIELRASSIVPIITNRWGVHNSMNEGVKMIGEVLHSDKFRALVCGSDTHIYDVVNVADYIRRADSEGVSFVASMKVNMGPYKDARNFIEEVSDWAEIEPPGYGFYYGDLWRDYGYHNDPTTGEDGYFLKDNFYSKGLKVRYAKGIKLGHLVRQLV